MYSCGDNNRGQLGIKFNFTTKTIPTPVWSEGDLAEGYKIVRIGCGSEHAIALSENGVLFIWGSFDFGVLGFEAKTDFKEPKRMDASLFGNNKIISISAGIFFLLKNNPSILFLI